MRSFRRLLWSLCLVACGCSAAKPEPESHNPADIGADADPNIVAMLPITVRPFDMGTAGYVPKGYPNPTSQDWADFFAMDAAAYGGVFGVHVSPAAPADADHLLDQVVLAFEQVQYVDPYIALAVDSESGPFTEARGEELKQAALAIVAHYRPKYLSLGVESNSLYLSEPDTFPLYVQYARETYDAVKAVSPNTVVMNNFQLERMRGASDLTGESPPAHWDVIDAFQGKLDAVSFTVYPFLHYKTVAEIPEDYLQAIRDHTALPVIITETGWPTRNLATGVSGSDQAQIDYMLTLITQAQTVDVQTVIWVFPHDAAFGIAGGIFDHVSLFQNDGTAKPAYAYWKAVNALPHE